MNHPIELRRMRTYGEKINDSFLFLKQDFKGLLKMYLLMVAPFNLLGGIFIFSLIKTFTSIAGGGFNRSFHFNYGLIGGNLIFGIIFLLLVVVSANIASMAYIRAYEDCGDQPPSLREIWIIYKQNFLKVLGHLMALFGIGVLLLLFSMLFAFIPIIGPFILFAAWIYIGVVLSIYFPVIIIEKLSFSEGITRCFQLIKNNWWSTFGFFITMTGLIYCFNIFLQLIASGLVAALSVSFIGSKSVWLITLIYGINYFITCFFYLILLMSFALQYYHLSEKKDAFGLQQRIEMIGSELYIQEDDGQEA